MKIPCSRAAPARITHGHWAVEVSNAASPSTLPPQAAEKFECPRLTKVARALAALRREQTVTATILPRMSKARSRAGDPRPCEGSRRPDSEAAGAARA